SRRRLTRSKRDWSSDVCSSDLGKPQKVITDQAPSTKVAMAKVIKAFKLKPDCHCTSKYLNNLIEQDHRHIKVRKTRYQSINTAKNTLKGIECIYALYKK